MKREDQLRDRSNYAANLIKSSLDMIVSTDKDRLIVEFNSAACRTFGYSKDEVAGKHVGILYAKKEDASRVFSSMVEKGDFIGEVSNIRKNGDIFPSMLSATVLCNDEGDIVGTVGNSRDITEQKRLEDTILSALEEKNALLKEVHHRVKNNFQVIISLMRLQSSSIGDKRLKEMFNECENRIKSMALVHEMLYRSEDMSHIDFSKYLQNLANSLLSTYEAISGKIKVETEVNDVHLSINTSISLGIVINELISNAVKYAFPEGIHGKIWIGMRRVKGDNNYEILVKDNGVGLPEGFDIMKKETLGLRLVKNIVEGQLNGIVEVMRNRGAEFRITFKEGIHE